MNKKATSAAVKAGRLSKAAMRLLIALDHPDAVSRPDPTRTGTVIVMRRRGDMSLGAGHHAAAAVAELLQRDLARSEDGRPSGWVRISEPGRAYRARASATEDGFGAQHRDLVRRAVATDGDRATLLCNALESPLEWLHRRRGPDGHRLIDAAQFEAGERLRRELTLAGMLPSVTARWEGAVATGGGPREPAGATDAVIAARQRVRAALDAVGGELANLLVDLCGFLKGLEVIERERRWPPRSGKVVVRLALGQLARHYGFEAEARGPDRSRGVRAWEAGPDPRATVPRQAA